MSTKTNGAEFKRFYSDKKYWPDNSDTYHDDEIFRVNGEDVSDDFDMSHVDDSALVEIEGGGVYNSTLYVDKDAPSLETYFRRWKREQTTTIIIVECDVGKLADVKAAIKAAGGKLP